MTEEADIIVIGAGAAGLAAARELSAADLKVIVLEARNRINGRINTHFDRCPIELGAEFVHGKPPETLKIVERARLTLQQVPNNHWHFHNGVLTKSGEFWSKVEGVMEAMSRYSGPDQGFAEFLDDYKRKTQIKNVRSIATLYVEGFHAADAHRISVHGLNKTNKAAEEIEDDKQFRIQDGYRFLTQALYDDAVARGANFHLNTVAEKVHWKQNDVEVLTRTGDSFKARRLLVTVPLTLLQNPARLGFTPPLNETVTVARNLAMGHVVKIILRFREPFWVATDELKNLTFIHAPDETLPTWWTQFPANAPLLTGWAGGPRAERLLNESDDSLLDHALRSLTHIFRTSKASLEELLEEFYTHNWQHDEFAGGAYSYIPVGGTDAQAQLARPLEGTIFFAGEATNTEGHQGTVHGAIASGLRAARDIVNGLHDSHDLQN